ncbi:MAG TPA: hypothetical protein VL404_08455 [Candidatus Eisenbacteria bacterium]|nr:hypothetical protein [Candidatus Eisenbacteria bacterium]
MKKLISGSLAVLTVLVFCAGDGRAASEAVKSPEISLALEPAQYAFVNGDASQFRAHHWMATGASGGVKEFGFEDEYPEGVTLTAEGHAIPDNGDYGAEIKLEKEGFGYLLLDYTQFRKYYGSSGGLYNAFTTLKSSDTDRDLTLNIGELSLEAGLRMENLPEITLDYTHEFKYGTKSRLTWTGVTEGPTVSGGAPDVLRKIGPSWQQIDEDVNKFGIKAEDELYGFHWHSEQEWEYVRAKNLREEKNLSTTPAAASGSNSDQKIRDQYTEPRSDLFTTILGLNKWFTKDKVYASSDYRFSQLNGRELENTLELDQNGVPTNFSNPETILDAHSDNLYTSNTWVGSVSSFLWNPLTVNTRLKAESIGRTSASTYPHDNSPANNNGASKPNGAVDQIDVSENQSKVSNFGEGLSFRYTGIPRTAIYNEYEFQQTRNNLYEDRRSPSAGEVFSRQSISHMYRGSGVLGASFSPWNPVTLTTDVRHREDAIHYNNVRYTDNSASGAKSVFIDAQDIETNEWSSKIRFRPCRWFQPSFRVQLQDTAYETQGSPDSDNWQEAGMESQIYTWDVVIQPVDALLTTTSLSVQKAKMFTPARFDTTPASRPTYNADVLSALFSAEYSVNPDVVLTGLTQWSDAGDFNNLGGAISYGADYTELDVSVGVRWTPRKDMTIEPKVAYYRYDPSPDLELGGYDAQVVSLDVSFKWG